MKVSRSILTILVVLTALLMCSPHNAHAAEGKKLESRHHMELKVSEDGSIEVQHTIHLENKTSQIITKYRIGLPWEPSSGSVSSTRDGAKHAISKSGSKWLLNMVGNPLRSGASTEFVIAYAVDRVAQHDFGLYKLYIPPFKSSERLTGFTANVQFPGTWPDVAYVSDRSAQQNENLIAMDKVHRGATLLWGNNYQIYLKDRIESRESGNIINLIPSFQHQEVNYQSLTLSRVASEENGNVWLYPVEPQLIEYAAAVTISREQDPNSFTAYHYTYLPLPVELEYISESQLTKRSRAEALYNHLVESLKPQPGANITLVEWPDQLFGGDPSGNALAYAYTLAGYLAYADVPHRIAYGYIWEMDELSSDLMLPSVWIEAVLDDRIVLMDPFSEDITGSHFFDAGVVNRLTMGYWNPKNTEDTILGLLSEGRRSRPVLVDPFTLEENRQYSATLSVPKSVPTAEPYTINLKLENHSGNILLLDKILWDAEDVSGHLEVNHVLTLAAPPHGSLTIPLYNIVFPALLYDGEAVHKVAISPENSLFTPAIVSYSILYTPNVKLLLVGIAVVASLLLGGIIYSWRRKLI